MTDQHNERVPMQTRDERANLATTDPVMIGVVAEIRAAGLKPAQRSEVIDLVYRMRDKTMDGHGVTAARLAITAADHTEDPDVARVFRKIAPRLVTGKKR